MRELGLIDLVAQFLDATRVRTFSVVAKLKDTRLGQWITESGRLSHKCVSLSAAAAAAAAAAGTWAPSCCCSCCR